MRFKMYNGSGYGLNGLTPTGGPIAAPLYLAPNPTAPLHAVTKDYVDSVLGHIPAANIVGTIPAERLPAFTGTDITSAGYGIFTLKYTGVIPGVYNKVTVNSKGLVISGELIDYSTLTNVAWDAITLDKPTTLEGYGITDALKTSGGVMTGPLYSTAAATANGHLVTKGYVDAEVSAKLAQGVGKIGDIVRMASGTTPANHLRTNGAVLDKTTYAALYAVIGDTYNSAGGGAGGYMGQPWRQQSAFNLTDNGVSQTWTTATSLPGTVSHSQAIVTQNRVYLLGVHTGSASSSTVYTAPIASDGTLGTWTTATSLPGTVAYSQAIVTQNRVYLLGGHTGSAASSTVYAAPFSGGSNDYLTLIANNTVDSTTQFRLPDYTLQETDSLYYYIKY